jgi:hypothetical protein
MTEPTEVELDDEEEVNAQLFENDKNTEVDQSSPAYKKTMGTTRTLKSKTRHGPASTPAGRKTTKKVATLPTHTFFVDIGIMLKLDDKATEWRSKIP